MKLPELRPRQPFTALALAAVAAIFAADQWEVNAGWALAVAAALAAGALWQPRTWLCGSFCFAAFFALHTLRHHGGEARRLAEEFAAGPRPVRVMGVVWSEPQSPHTPSRWKSCSFRLKLESIEIAGVPRASSALVQMSWPAAPPAYGDRVVLVGTGSQLEPVRNPGQFDAAAYQRRQGVHLEVRSPQGSDGMILSHGHGQPWQAFAIAARRWTKTQLERDLGDSREITALIESMVLGLRGETPDDVKELFQRTGTLHLFAVSGLNVAMLASIVWFVLKPLRVGRRASVLLIIPVLLAYALVTGLSASCVRATIMGVLLLAGHLFDRPPIHYNSLAAAALLILGWETNQLFSTGFQFSFVLVLALIFLTRRIERRLTPLARVDPFLPRALWSWRQVAGSFLWQRFAGALAVTFAAWIGSLLFTAGYFHLFSPASIFANLVAVPLAFGVLALGLASVMVASVAAWAAVLLNNANWLVAHLLLLTVKLFAAAPGGHVYVESPRFRERAPNEFTVLDAGSGGAIHLRAGGEDWLIDCGHGFTYERVVLPYLRSRGVNRLAGLILTHGDAQHMGSAPAVLDDFSPRVLIDSPLKDRSPRRRDLHQLLAQRQRGKRLLRRGDSIALGNGGTIRILFPPMGWARSVADDKALVLLLETGGTRVLFLSDSGFATEQWLLQNEPDLHADVLVKGRHSQDLSGTIDFIARVAPQAVICSAPNEYGAAAGGLDAWPKMVGDRGCALFRQERTGAVRVQLQRGEVRASAWVGGQTFRSRAR